MTKAMKYVPGLLAAVIVLATVFVIGISIGVSVASKNTNSAVLVSQTGKANPGFSSKLKNDLLEWTIKSHCDREKDELKSWTLTNEYEKENLQGDHVHFLEYQYYLAPLEPVKNDPNDPVSQKDLDYINEVRAQISESYKDPKTITLMITKRGHKWFILGPYPPPEKDLRMINGQLVDRNELMREPYPTRNE